MKKILFLMTIFQLYILSSYSHNTGRILSIDNNNTVYVDLTSAKINDIYNVYTSRGYFIHPITKKRIDKEPELIGKLKITKIYSNYSEAVAIPSLSIKYMKEGQQITKSENDSENIQYNKINQESGNYEKISVIITPAKVNDVVNNGFFGGYVADVLMEQLITNDRIKLIDRSILNEQINESDLQGRYIENKSSIEKGKISGARYVIRKVM